MGDLELELLEDIVGQLEKEKPDSEAIRQMREKILSAKLLRKYEVLERSRKPPIWQTEWFWRAVILLIALLLGVFDWQAVLKLWAR